MNEMYSSEVERQLNFECDAFILDEKGLTLNVT